MKTFLSVLLLLFVACLHVHAREELEAGAGVEASYNSIVDTCNHPVLLSAASFTSNFFCENVLKVAAPEIKCAGLLFRVVAAQAQIVSGANFKTTIALVDAAEDCVIAFRSKIYMPMPHTGQEPMVDMDQFEALACDAVNFDSACLQSLTDIDAYWEEEIENGGGEAVPATEEEWEKEAEEEEEIIEVVEEDLGVGGASAIQEYNATSPQEPGSNSQLTDENKDYSKEDALLDVYEEAASGIEETIEEEAKPTSAASSLSALDKATHSPEIPSTEDISTEDPTVPLSGSPTALTPSEALANNAVQDLIGDLTLSGESILDMNINSTEQAEEAEELVKDMETDIVEEISEEITEFEEEMEAEDLSGPYEAEDLGEYEDEATWAFAGKTDECSRFGTSPAEGIAFKCDKTVYICGETVDFREKFLLLMADPVVDGCWIGEVDKIFSSRGDCNFFPKNEHYLKRDGTQEEGHHLFCPNGKALDRYYMFCTQELDNYYCDGSDCETCAGTSRGRGRFLRH